MSSINLTKKRKGKQEEDEESSDDDEEQQQEEEENKKKKKKKKRAPAKPRAKRDPNDRVLPLQLNEANQKSKTIHQYEAMFPHAFSKSDLHDPKKMGWKENEDFVNEISSVRKEVKLEGGTTDDNVTVKVGDNQFQLYVEDCLQTLKSFRPQEGKYTVKTNNLAANMLRSVNYYMTKSTGFETTHVLTFDKYPLVPITKGAEHAKRKNKKASIPTADKTATLPDEGGEYFYHDQPIPLDWEDAKNDREGKFTKAIKFIVKCWIEPSWKVWMCTPLTGKRVIIDGHTLSRDELIELGVGDIDKCDKMFPDGVDFTCIPICIEKPKEGGKAYNVFPDKNVKSRPYGQRIVYLVPELYNELGEADFTTYYMIRRLGEMAKISLKTKVLSVDTDLVIYGLAYLRRWFSSIEDVKSHHLEKAIDREKSGKNPSSIEMEEYSYLPNIVIQNKPSPLWQLYADRPDEKLIEQISLKHLYVDMERSNFYRTSAKRLERIKKMKEDKEKNKNKKHNPTKKQKVIDIDQVEDIDTSGDDNNNNNSDEEEDDIDDEDDLEDEVDMLKSVSTSTASQNNKKKQMYTIKEKVMNMTLIWLVGGTDFNESFKGLTHEWISVALKTYSTWIGDVIKFSPDYTHGVTLDGEAYVRLIKAAFVVSKHKKFDGIHPQFVTPEMIDEVVTPKSPSPFDGMLLTYTLKHAQYIIQMMNQVGNDKLEFDGYAEMYGYRKIDDSVGWTRDNTKRVYSDDADVE